MIVLLMGRDPTFSSSIAYGNIVNFFPILYLTTFIFLENSIIGNIISTWIFKINTASRKLLSI